ncbi:MAG: FHA domain-containing protein, partial [Vicinamibacteria bacterium]
MRFLHVLGVAAALSFAPLSSFGQAPPDPSPGPRGSEPWGYLYFFRTLQLYPLALEENAIGRLQESEIVLTSPRVSRRHAVVRRDAEGIELHDVGSSNGTKRNGESLRPRAPVPLNPGDRIELAEELALFHISLPDLWRDELRHRLLASIVKLH